MSLAIKRGIEALEGLTQANPGSGARLIYPKSDGWYEKNSAGVELKVGPISGTKTSALPAISTLADADVLPVVNAGALKNVSLSQLTSYFEQRARQNNASVAQQAIAAVDLYLVGSDVAIPAGRLQAKSMYRCKIQIAKTSVAGTATPIVNVRFGTAGTTGDTTRATLTFAAQTGVADNGFLEVFVTFRTVGSGTSAILRSTAMLDHTLASTGLSTANVSLASATSGAGFDSTVANSRIGVSINMGASFTGTTDLVQAELYNLA